MAVGPGTILQSRYHIVELLDHGGMGQIWRGQDDRLNRAVAIKVMQDHYSDQESFERFVREARVAAGLDHPGITAVHDFGRHDNQYFIVMQLLKGQDLKAILKGHPMGLPARQVVSYAIQAAEALAAAHESGVIHRDLKPANLFIVAGERLKICDFGIAKHVDATRTLTRPGEVMGTPAYMSPEQWSGRPVDARSDLYSLGCVLYELLAGRPPFAPEQSVHALWAQHLQATPASPRNGTYLPSPLSDLVLRLLAKDPEDRPKTAASLVVELRDIDIAPPRTGAPSSEEHAPHHPPTHAAPVSDWPDPAADAAASPAYAEAGVATADADIPVPSAGTGAAPSAIPAHQIPAEPDAYRTRIALSDSPARDRARKRTVYTPPPRKAARREADLPWMGPAVVVCLVTGLAWIVAYYITNGSFPGMSALGGWNLLVGFALIIAGVTLSTRRR
jgi:serine/threonine protein kinase